MSIILRTLLSFEDKADQLKDVADRWVAATRTEEGVVAFDAFIDEEGGRLIFLEHYRDSEAFMIHKDLVSTDLRTELYSIARFESLEIYGNPSEEMKNALAAARARVFNHVASR